MKIQQHPRMKDVLVGDDVLCHGRQLYARVEEVFPAAVCVRLLQLQQTLHGLRLIVAPQLWGADEIENLSVCRYCGSRDAAFPEAGVGIPYRACVTCRSVQSVYVSDALTDHVSH